MIDNFERREHRDPDAGLNRLFGRHRAAGEQKFGRALITDALYEEVAAARLGHDTKRDERTAKVRIIADEVDVGMEEHCRPETDRRAADGGDDGLLNGNELIEEPLKADLAALRHRAHLREILPRGEVLPRATKKDNAHLFIALGPLERVRERKISLIIEGVTDLQSIDDELAHMSPCGLQDIRGHGGHYRELHEKS